MDFIAALSFGGNIAMGSDGNDEEKTDIQTQINQTLNMSIPSDITIWNETI